VHNTSIPVLRSPSTETAGSAPNAAMIHGLFSQKNLKITIDRKLYRIVHFYFYFFVPHQNDVATTKIMKKFYEIVEHPLDPAVCINMHPFLMYTST
jgi:hypothetical protein